jgi:hypothetical protein
MEGIMHRIVVLLVLGIVGLFSRSAQADGLAPSMARYKSYVIEQVQASQKGLVRFVAHLSANDMTGARKAWVGVVTGWECARPLAAGLFPDLERSMDGSLETRSGFFAIGAELQAAPQPTDLGPIAEKLRLQLVDLEKRIRNEQLTTQGPYDGMFRVVVMIGKAKPSNDKSNDRLRDRLQGVGKLWGTVFEAPMERVKRDADVQIDKNLTTLKRMLDSLDASKPDVELLVKAADEIAHALLDAAPSLGLEIPKAGS